MHLVENMHSFKLQYKYEGKSHRTLKNSNTAFQIYLFIFLSVFALVRYSWFYIQVLILSPASCLYKSPLLFTINSTAL